MIKDNKLENLEMNELYKLVKDFNFSKREYDKRLKKLKKELDLSYLPQTKTTLYPMYETIIETYFGYLGYKGDNEEMTIKKRYGTVLGRILQSFHITIMIISPWSPLPLYCCILYVHCVYLLIED